MGRIRRRTDASQSETAVGDRGQSCGQQGPVSIFIFVGSAVVPCSPHMDRRTSRTVVDGVKRRDDGRGAQGRNLGRTSWPRP